MKAFITKSSGVNMDHPYFFGIMFRHVAKTEQPCRDVVQVRIGLIWWHIGITFTSGLCTSNAAGQGREGVPCSGLVRHCMKCGQIKQHSSPSACVCKSCVLEQECDLGVQRIIRDIESPNTMVHPTDSPQPTAPQQ